MQRVFFAAALSALAAAPALAGSALSVPLDEVRVVAFSKPVATLYVGNPVIADVTIIDSRHAFVQAKAFGATNVVAIDSSGKQIANQQIVVAAKGSSQVTLQRGTQQTTYSCTGGHCQATPQPGDGQSAFDTAATQIEKYQGMVTKAASGSSGQ
jgi:hypothetical protein